MAHSHPENCGFTPTVSKMAEASVKENCLPQKGKVEKVCKQWSVHEDGAMAYKLQTEENDMHFGQNRFQRRTVREDIPVAKFVQTEEERKQQEERLLHLEKLKTQAERDAEIAKHVQEQEKQKAWKKNTTELDDEAIARHMQEKEKKRYERHLEKKKEKELKKKREKLEKELAEQSENARMRQGNETDEHGIDQLNGSTDRLSLEDSGSAASGHTRYTYRVTPGGRIEDDGDFSDFYSLPPGDDNDPVRRHMQQTQDEELARLLQEQEHKRNKAEVDKNKLKAMEIQDEELARVIQEQENLKARKAKQKRQQLKEKQRLQQQQQTPSSRSSTERPLPNPESSEQPPYQHRYRRDSYTRSISNNSGPVQESPATVNTDSSHHLSDEEPWYNLPEDDITSARELTQSHKSSTGSRSQQDKNSQKFSPRGQNGVSQITTQRSHEQHNIGRLQHNEDLPPSEIPSVERWLAESVPSRQPRRGQTTNVLPPSPSPPGSYHSEEESPESHEYLQRNRLTNNRSNTGTQSFNIAAAIDPTYKRRQHEFDESPGEQTHQKSLTCSHSLPVEVDVTEEVEWDPAGLRGSLRRPKGQWNPTVTNYQESSTISSMRSEQESPGDGGPVMNAWQPVQGQRRSTLDNRRKGSKTQGSGGKNGKGGSCKQQ